VSDMQMFRAALEIQRRDAAGLPFDSPTIQRVLGVSPATAKRYRRAYFQFQRARHNAAVGGSGQVAGPVLIGRGWRW